MRDKILIVEDELIVARDLRRTLERNGFKVIGVAKTAEKAIELINQFEPSFILLDIFLKGDQTGIDVAKYVNKKAIPFIYISANSNQEVLEAAKVTDPYGFIVKPFREVDILVAINIAVYRHESKLKMLTNPDESTLAPGKEFRLPAVKKIQHTVCENIIGRSSGMLKVFNQIAQVAEFDTSVLLLGESGTGKEGIANCIVQRSNRSNRPYIKINCAAIPEELIESELFGHEKGAFTGATERKTGKFEMAAGGTILLDEIGEIAPEVQVKLLRVLQEKEIQRIGGHSVIKTDVRVLAATSRNLEKEVAEERFRLDLYYRLLVFPINIPPLRDRKEDIALLIEHFIRHYSQKLGKRVNAITAAMLKKLTEYHWPGNVRELQHVIERNVLIADGEIITEIDLPQFTLFNQEKTDAFEIKLAAEIERDKILSVLRQCNFRISGTGGAAEFLNLSPTTLQYKLRKLGIKIGYE